MAFLYRELLTTIVLVLSLCLQAGGAASGCVNLLTPTNAKFSASSSNEGPHFAEINSKNYWCSEFILLNQSLTVDLGFVAFFDRLLVQGRPESKISVSTYLALTSIDGVKFSHILGSNERPYQFRGPFQNGTIITDQNLTIPIQARYVRFNPIEPMTGDLCMRVGVESCQTAIAPVHGQWSQWSEYGPCSAPCFGFSKRTRTCSSPAPLFGGNPCPGIKEYIKACFDCKETRAWSNWGFWSACSATCGPGQRQRQRTCTNLNCVGSSTQTGNCLLRYCPVDGGWSAWSAFSRCTRSCGGGRQYRSRSCSNPFPRHGGRDCVGIRSFSRSCNTGCCPGVDGGWGPWGPFSSGCPVTCGGGTRTRSRTCNSPAPSCNGNPCTGSSQDTQTCNILPCPRLLNTTINSWSSTTLPTKTTCVTESPALTQRPHTNTIRQNRAVPSTFASLWRSHITSVMSLNNQSTTFMTTIPASLAKVSQTSSSATQYTRKVSDHPLESSVDNTPKPSYGSRKTFLTTSLTLKVSSSTPMPDASWKPSTVTVELHIQPTPISSKASVVTQRASGSSVVSNPVPKTSIFFPTTFNSTPRIEASSKSSTVSIPPNVGTGRKKENAGLYIGISTGITAFVIVTVIIVGRLVYRRQRSKMRNNQESYAKNSSTSTATDRAVDEVTEFPNENSQIHCDFEHVYAVLRTDKREQAIYSSTYSVPQSPAVVDASDASLGLYPHPDTEKNNNCQGNTEESLYDDVMPPKCEPASENNEAIDKELTVVKITEESCHTGSAQLKGLNKRKSFGRHCYEIFPERLMYINLQELPVSGSLENNSDSEVMCYNLY